VERCAGGAIQISEIRNPQSAIQKLLWLPSQNGLFFVCLQPHQATVFFAVISVLTGENSVPLCDPSQNGCVLERPQAHHQ
jgi:hypothetical protein